jgi:hypothetical protein
MQALHLVWEVHGLAVSFKRSGRVMYSKLQEPALLLRNEWMFFVFLVLV